MSTPSDAERFRSTLSSMLYFNSEGGDEDKKKQEEGSAGGASSAGGQAAAPSRRECRPGDRRDFLRRLATFRRGRGWRQREESSPSPHFSKFLLFVFFPLNFTCPHHNSNRSAAPFFLLPGRTRVPLPQARHVVREARGGRTGALLTPRVEQRGS